MLKGQSLVDFLNKLSKGKVPELLDLALTVKRVQEALTHMKHTHV